MLFWLICIAMSIHAAELPLDGCFAELDEAGLPARWLQHRNWDGFKPFASLMLLPGLKPGENALRLFDTQSPHGVCVRTNRRQKGVSGDQIEITLKAKGEGIGWVGLYFYTADGKWNQTSQQQTFSLQKDWSEHSFKLFVANGNAGETAFFDVTFGGKQGMDAQFTDIRVEQQPAKYRGELVFPKHWKVFAPVDPSFQPTAELLDSLPDSFAGLPAKNMRLQGHELDFALIMNRQERELCGWAFAELDAPFACDYTIGAGADWWMTYYVNGEKVIDTTKTGNNKFPFQINNHLATLRLRAGKNILAVRLLTGAKSSVLLLGGPEELRKMRNKLKISHVHCIDDYDHAETNRKGNPEIIQGNPTPGLLAVTGQGVYHSAGNLDISLPQTAYRMPAEKEKYFSTGVRIQNFGRRRRVDSSLSFAFQSVEERFALQVAHAAESDELLCSFIENGKTSKRMSLPYKMLPADFLFSAGADGSATLTVSSLADSSTSSFLGNSTFFQNCKNGTFDLSFFFSSESSETAELVLDNLMTGECVLETTSSQIPYRIELDREFDPVKAGWQLVFADEFDGEQVDLKKWNIKRNPAQAKVDGKGHLLIRTEWDKNGDKLISSSLWSKEKFKYGYFESRLKFTRQPGWWAAFWLYGSSNSNPTLDGFEIDIFEDYYTRPKKADEETPPVLDHNLHVYTGSLLKSWNYNSKLPGSLDDFYVIGCKWTPFEISYYLNGRQIKGTASHSPYDTVTFDAMHHIAGISPLHAIVSAQIMSETWFSSAKNGVFPEDFVVDYVRVYAYPEDDAPQISLPSSSTLFVEPGELLRFVPEIKLSPHSQAPVKAVYLFDNGYLLAHTTQAPYVIEIPFTPDFYAGSNYMKPGRSGKIPAFDSYTHAYCLFVQDSNGKTAHSETVLKVLKPSQASSPWQGRAQQIPGKILAGHYDEGGLGVAYHDSSPGNYTSKNFRVDEDVDCAENAIGHVTSGEWINYSVEISQAGKYSAELLYGTPFAGEQGLQLYLDGELLGAFRLFQHEGEHWSCDTLASIQGLELPAGRHQLTILMIGGFNMSTLEFKAE